MIIEYINEIISKVKFEILEWWEGFYAEIPWCPWVWAQSENLENCRNELEEVLEEWVALKINKKCLKRT